MATSGIGSHDAPAPAPARRPRASRPDPSASREVPLEETIDLQPDDGSPDEFAETTDFAAAPNRGVSGAVAVDGPELADDAEELEEVYAENTRRFLMFTAMPSWLVSLVVHAVLIVLLALMTIPEPVKTVRSLLTVRDVPTEEIDDLPPPEDLPQELELDTNSTMDSAMEEFQVETPLEMNELALADDLDMAAADIQFSDFSDMTAPESNLVAEIGASVGAGLSGRGAAERGRMVREFGGTKESEAAVAMALEWLARHQLPDGGWCFDHTIGPGIRVSPNPGTMPNARNGATAMALLPFLGAGQTHKEGEYKEVVERGLYFLLSQIKANGSFHESGGSMYSHGLCAIVLCEAYAMTNDRALMAPAQASLNFIAYAQDPVGGGWRYNPRTPGDTSVVGWQLMALKSGHMAYLQVSPNTVLGASRFLDSVQSESGAMYGYTSPGNGRGTSAVGLLCRMYLGWKHDNSALEDGVKRLLEIGPSDNNFYFNYYATQVMRHFGGDPWDKWNGKMRDFYVKTQSKEGPSKGSWFGRGDHGADRGGRLYCTSMATMVLEVYYRHMPIYGKAAAEEEFPLE